MIRRLALVLCSLAVAVLCGPPLAPAAEWPTPINASTLAGVTPGTGGLAVLDDASPSAIRTTLSLGAAALLTQVARSYVFFDAAATAWTNQPAATTEVFGTQVRRIPADLTGVTSMRAVAVVSVAGVAGSKVGVQYSTNGGTTWVFMDGSADGDLGTETPQVSIAGTGTMASSYMTIDPAAAGNVLLRFIGDDGDGAGDPQFTYLGIEVK